jgi:hypothetical protein
VALDENHELLVLRFRADSAILARIGLDEEVVRISTYRFRYLPAPHVSS